MLFRHVNVVAGQRVLIQGGGGGVGWFAVQLARAAGAEVSTTARPVQHEALRALGAEPFDYRDADYPECIRERTKGGVDLAFDGLGAEHFRPSLRALHAAGRLVIIGASDAVARGAGMTAPVVSALARNVNPFGPCVSFYSITLARSLHPAHFREDLALLYQRLAAGALQVRIDRRIGFAEVARAHADLERGGVAGKIVLLPD